MRYSNNSTTNFMRHLRNKHPFELQSYEEHASTASGQQGAESSATSLTSIATPAPAVCSSMPTAMSVSHTSTSSTVNAPQAASISTTAVPSTQRGATSAHAAATKQMTLEAVIERTIKYKPGSTRKKEIDACVLQLVTTDLQPLSIVDNKAFRQLMQKMDPRDQERFRNINSKDQLRLATLLDPRFKHDEFSHKTYYDEAVDKLKRMAEGISLPATQPVEEPAAGSEEAPTPAKKIQCFVVAVDAKRKEKKRSSA
ncbi:transposase [Elysia marginata]|uniref:Transposase n=1 Tax=Elysia marginata TaxID=1093978 RepID=A0AAV4EWP6_9GAST|nr:transposase [Elysia marginata]